LANPDPAGWTPGIDDAPPASGAFAPSPKWTMVGCVRETGCGVVVPPDQPPIASSPATETADAQPPSAQPSGSEAPDEQPAPAVQAKLAVGPADDPLEREADAVAERVMRMPARIAAPREPTHVVQQRPDRIFRQSPPTPAPDQPPAADAG